MTCMRANVKHLFVKIGIATIEITSCLSHFQRTRESIWSIGSSGLFDRRSGKKKLQKKVVVVRYK